MDPLMMGGYDPHAENPRAKPILWRRRHMGCRQMFIVRARVAQANSYFI